MRVTQVDVSFHDNLTEERSPEGQVIASAGLAVNSNSPTIRIPATILGDVGLPDVDLRDAAGVPDGVTKTQGLR